MKIEKLTENKIRVIVKPSDLDIKNLDIRSFMTKALKEQNFFTNMLKKAKEEVGFNTDGCKLLIETFSSSDDIFIFTITKYSPQESQKNSNVSNKKLTVKRKTVNFLSNQEIYRFTNFDEFCNFCECINNTENLDIKSLSKNISLYLYNDTYYLIIKNINTSYQYRKTFYSIASEFLTPFSCSNSFESKLLEHGTAIMKKMLLQKELIILFLNDIKGGYDLYTRLFILINIVLWIIRYSIYSYF